jgi:hypothetical protein
VAAQWRRSGGAVAQWRRGGASGGALLTARLHTLAMQGVLGACGGQLARPEPLPVLSGRGMQRHQSRPARTA